MLSINEILKISRETSISLATIGQLIELILSRNRNIQDPSFESLKLELERFIANMKSPQKRYSIRIKLGNKSERNSNPKIHKLVEDFSNQYTGGIRDPQIPNLYYFYVNGPLNLQEYNNKIEIDRFAAESVMIGANLYIPGLINNKSVFMKNDYISMYGSNSIHVGNGVAKIDSKNISANRKGMAIETTQSLYQLPQYRTSNLYNEGIISDQVFASLIACWTLMSLYSHDARILDMCSAPGHKTCVLSEIGHYLNNGVYPNIISVDRSSNRLEALKEDVKRLKLENINIITSKIQKLADKHPELIGANDLVVLDPPCSALGTRPKIMIEHSWEDYRDLFLTQRSFLKLVDKFVKSEGYLLYNTCTLTLLENEGIVSYAKDKLDYKIVSAKERLDKLFPDRFFKDVKDKDDFGNELYSGIPFNDSLNDSLIKINNISFDSNSFSLDNLADLQKYHALSEEDCKKVCRTYLDDSKTTGYFFALLQKK